MGIKKLSSPYLIYILWLSCALAKTLRMKAPRLSAVGWVSEPTSLFHRASRKTKRFAVRLTTPSVPRP